MKIRMFKKFIDENHKLKIHNILNSYIKKNLESYLSLPEFGKIYILSEKNILKDNIQPKMYYLM